MKDFSKSKLLLFLITIILLIQSVSILNLSKRVASLESVLSQFQAQVSTQIDSISGDLQSTLNHELSKSYLIERIDFKLNDIKDNQYTLNIVAELKKYPNDSKVYFMYKDINEAKWKEIQLIQSDTLSFSGNMTYLPESNYEYKVVINGDTLESSNIEALDKYQFMPYPPSVSYGETYGKNETLTISPYLYSISGEYVSSASINQNFNIDTKIKEIEIILNTGSKEKSYKCNYRFDEIEIYDENGDTTGKFEKTEYYDAEIPKSDYKKNGIQSISMKITYDNNLIDVVDIADEVDASFIN